MMSELATYDEKTNETEDSTLKALTEIGEYAWSILFPRHETESTVHGAKAVYQFPLERNHTRPAWRCGTLLHRWS